MTMQYLIQPLKEWDSIIRQHLGCVALLLSEMPPVFSVTIPGIWDSLLAYHIVPDKLLSGDCPTYGHTPFWLRCDMVTVQAMPVPEPAAAQTVQRQPIGFHAPDVQYHDETTQTRVAAATMPKRNRRERQCLNCGKELTGRKDKKYCDDSCRQAGRRSSRNDVTAHVQKLTNGDQLSHGSRSKSNRKNESRLKHSAAASKGVK